MRDGGRFARVEHLALLDSLLSPALAAGQAVPGHITRRLAADWPSVREGLVNALNRRLNDKRASLEGRLARRREDEERRITANLERFAATLRRALARADDPESEYTQLMLELRDERELLQARADQAAWRSRLDRLATEREAELDRIRRRYADPKDHLFPVAVVFVVPKREVVR
jgi:hypothetical protein